VAIYVATTLAIVVFVRGDSRLLGLLAGGAVLFVTGLVDDFRHLRPHTKLVVQIVAACALVVAGVQVGTPNLAPIAIPLTI
jgi:UDP-GlcNAc:undecaprenyl-phosphate GlcNAc-1-phosphate transferase